MIRSLFTEIAGVYDRMNHLLSLGMDRRWRRIAAAEAKAGDDGDVRARIAYLRIGLAAGPNIRSANTSYTASTSMSGFHMQRMQT